MAIFEQKPWGKVILDDTEVLKVTFQSSINIQGHTEYVIHVQRGPNPDRAWDICKRYNDFVGLHHAVVHISGLPIALPPKKIIGNMDRYFIAERQLALETYLNNILMNPILASNLAVKRFLDPKNYVLSLQELAAQQVSMVLRSEVNYELLKAVPEIGWRLRKQYLMVRARLNPKTEMCLQWVQYGPDKYLNDRDIHLVLKSFVHLCHPHIEPPEFIHCSESGCFMIRRFYPEGSLRDFLCNAKPKLPFLKKYGCPKQTRCLSEGDISVYGRQILDGLLFLRDKDIPYGHLHAGNVLLVDGQAKLLDVENGALGVPSYLRPFFVQHKKVNTLEAIDVYSFGHLLFEMAMGSPLMESVCDNFPPSCPPSVRSILELILTSERLRNGLPHLTDLAQHPLFAGVRINSQHVSFKLLSSVRESLRASSENLELRLKNEQKMVRNRKKLAKVQELLTSEDQLKKRNHRLREEKKASHMEAKAGRRSPPRSESPTSTSTAGARSPPRSESPTSTSTAGTVTPPLQGVKPTPSAIPSPSNGRTALLDSICSFDKQRLRPRTVNGVTY